LAVVQGRHHPRLVRGRGTRGAVRDAGWAAGSVLVADVLLASEADPGPSTRYVIGIAGSVIDIAAAVLLILIVARIARAQAGWPAKVRAFAEPAPG
jgi:hypothetical protein